MSFLWHGYVSLLQRHTLFTQMGTSSCTSGLGDVIYQQAFEKRGWQGHEFYRTRRLMIYGGLCWAPAANRWHAVLNRIHVGGKWSTVVARGATDAMIFAPFSCCLFYTSQGLLEGRPIFSTPDTQGIYDRLKERVWTTTQRSWSLFVPVQLINLSIMPVYARPPFMSAASCVWSVYLASAQKVGSIPPVDLPKTNVVMPKVKSPGEEPLSVVVTETV